jgi:hypothetical protein|tara:strand:- start:10226 stop:10558 length:333 start_codon:yes stop_codon:yes gene_type:complete
MRKLNVDKSYSKYKTRVAINHAFATAGSENIVVFWPKSEASFIAIKQSLAVGANSENTVGIFDSFTQTTEVLDCCDAHMLKLKNRPMTWPKNESRIDIIGSNGNSGEHYK